MEVVRVAHFTQKTVTDFLKLIGFKETAKISVSGQVPQETAITVPTLSNIAAIHTPIDVSGFFKVTGPHEVTFYATTTWNQPVGPGWTALNVTGLIGQLVTTGSSNVTGNSESGVYKINGPDQLAFYSTNTKNQTVDQTIKDAIGKVVAIGSRNTTGNVAVSSLVSEPYNWSFTLQSDTDQVINEVRYANSAVLYPPGTVPIVNKQKVVNIQGYYTVSEHLPRFIFTGPVPNGFGDDWVVSNLLPLTDSYTVQKFGKLIYGGTDKFGKPKFVDYFTGFNVNPAPNNATPVYLTARASPPTKSLKLTTIGTFTTTEPTQGTVRMNPNIVTGLFTKFRDLNTDYMFPEEPRDFNEVKDKGFSSAATLALFAKGPQDEFLVSNDPLESQWNPSFKQHTNSIMVTRITKFPGPSPTYEGNVVNVVLYPNQVGDLLSNMYLRLNLPSGVKLAPNIGRSIIKRVEFIVNETIVETLYDDWYIIRDQMLLDADEQYTMNQAMQGINSEIIIPLEFFFCRRHSVNNSNRERLRRPYFPVCAMTKQFIYVRFTFQPYTWWTNSATPVDILNPVIITEEILLENRERMYYRNTPLRYVVNDIKKDGILSFNSNQPVFNMTASCPVQTLIWFFRNKNYENVDNQNYYDSRYTYGYTTQYIHSAVPLSFPSGNSNFVDIITSAKITLNNIDVTSVLPGGLYFGFKQPMEHSLSIPSKNIYSYSFGLTPKEYNQGGFLNFSKLNSQTTTLTLVFNPVYTTQVQQGYNLYVFYYGYNFLQFQGGFAGLPLSS